MSQDAAAAGDGAFAGATPKDAFFFATILTNMKNKPDVDWEVVAAKAGYNNANTAKVRFGQIKRKLGFTEEGGSPAAPKSTPKPRTPKKKTEVGSGTNTSPSKVRKTPTKPRGKKAKAEAEEQEAMKTEDADMMKVEDAEDAKMGEDKEEVLDEAAIAEKYFNSEEQHEE